MVAMGIVNLLFDVSRAASLFLNEEPTEEINVAKRIGFWFGVATLVLLAINELFHIADRIGLLDYIPAYAKWKRAKEQEKLKGLLEMHNEMILQNEQNRVEHLLELIGIVNKRYVANLRQASEFIRALTIRSRTDYQQQLRYFCTRFVIDQEKVPGDQIILYSEVRYYIDFMDATANAIYGEKLAEVMQCLIANQMKVLKEKPDEAIYFDRIAVPIGGNYFLGQYLAERLRKPLVVILNQPRIYTNCYWMGELKQGEKLIMINDVGVTGKRLIDSAEIIRTRGHADVQHIFVLVERTEFNARSLLAECPEPLYLHSMVEMNDQQIATLLGQSNQSHHSFPDAPLH